MLDEDALELGTRIRGRRLALGMSLVRLAEETGLSHPFLSQVERGHARPSVTSLRRIASALDVDTGWLFGAADAASEPGGARVVRGVSTNGNGDRRLAAPGWPLVLDEIVALTSDFGEPVVRTGPSTWYVVDGEVEVDVDGGITTLGAGDGLLVPAGVACRARSTGSPLRVIVAALDDAST